MPPELSGRTDASPLEKLNERLYTPGSAPHIEPPALARQPQPQQKTQSWQTTPLKRPKKRLPLPVIFFCIALAFFVIAIGVSWAFIAFGTRLVSNNNITITVQGPTTIASGTAVPLVVTVTNHNPAAISNADITMIFPDGTRSADDPTQPLVRYTDTFGTLNPGQSVNQTVQAVLFGSVNQTVTIPVTFEYRTANSDALFTKQQNYTFTITSAPLTLTVHSVSSVASGQPVAIQLAVQSNATTPLTNIAVAAQYPFGFTPAASGNATSTPFIYIGTLAPGQEKDYTIEGTLAGTDNTQLAFQFTVGTASNTNTQSIAVPYASQGTQITISKPFLATTLSINNSDANPLVIPSGQSISGFVSWVNSLAAGITNGEIEIQLSGSALNPSGVQTANGYYNSSNQTILFSKQTEGSLANLNPGDTGNGSFSITPKSGTAFTSLHNPTIQLSVSVAGHRGDTGTDQTINNTLVQTIQFATDLELNSSITHTTGPFKNSGPLPPVPNQATTYTVLWSVTNTVNDVGGGTVTAILPPYVTFTGQVTPNDGSLTYDATSHTVTWKIGDIPADTMKKPIQASFQISFTPSATQANSSPIVVGNQTLVGTDRFTNTPVGNTVDALSIQTPNDPNYQTSFGNVAN